METNNHQIVDYSANKSYISRIEKGITVPSVATFYRIINALGLTIELKPAL